MVSRGRSEGGLTPPKPRRYPSTLLDGPIFLHIIHEARSWAPRTGLRSHHDILESISDQFVMMNSTWFKDGGSSDDSVKIWTYSYAFDCQFSFFCSLG